MWTDIQYHIAKKYGLSMLWWENQMAASQDHGVNTVCWFQNQYCQYVSQLLCLYFDIDVDFY